MKKFKKEFLRPSFLNIALVSGILGFLSYPTVLFGVRLPDFGVFAWFYLVPLLVVLHGSSFKNKLWYAFLSFNIFNFGVFYWLIIAMKNFGGLDVFESLLTMFLFSLIISISMAVPFSFALWSNHKSKIPLAIGLPVFMMARDVLFHSFPFGGFPWGVPAYSQGQWIQFFQWIDTTGMFGLNAYIYLVNGLFADGVILFLQKKELDKLVTRFLVVFVLALFSIFLSSLSSQSYEKAKQTKGALDLAIIQGNISQDVKWNRFLAPKHLDTYIKLSMLASKNGAELVLWPETAFPFGLQEDYLFSENFLDRESFPANFFIGSVVYRGSKDSYKQYNSVVHIAKNARVKEIYNKQHLVPFGEYLPMAGVLSYLGELTKGVGQFDRGDGFKILKVKGVQFGSLICFEDVFIDIARGFAKRGVDVLVNYTNDAWYENSSAQYQHVVFSQFRALENRRPLVRVTNTGYSVIISPKGEIVDELQPFKKTYLLHNLKLEQAKSFYTQHGHRWVYVCYILAVLFLLYSFIRVKFGPIRE